jgi:hypothetical protein
LPTGSRKTGGGVVKISRCLGVPCGSLCDGGYNAGMDNAPVKSRRRFRFGLRTLLAVVTLAAVASWAYWIGWPWWLDYREQMTMERSIRQFQRGMPLGEFQGLVSGGSLQLIRISGSSDGMHSHEIFDFDIGRAVYIAYIELQVSDPNVPSRICDRLEFYRLPLPPIDYQACTTSENFVDSSGVTPSTSPKERSRMLYMADFREFLSGDRKNNPGFQYKLIYSDPPATPAVK